MIQFKAAVVQTSSVFFNSKATAEKACLLMEEASKNGAAIVAFPEVFISAYPYWNWLLSPIAGGEWFERLYHSAIESDGEEVEMLKTAAKKFNINVVIGCNEREKTRNGTIFNTNLLISHQGELLGKHRKLVPTWAEKLSWTGGDGSTLKVYQTNIGPLGTLACGENTNPLARYTLLSQGELVHVANYISLPVAPEDYNMAEAIKIRAAAHSFEGKMFTLVACSIISDEALTLLEKSEPKIRERFARKNSAFSGIIGPGGVPISEPLIDEEGIVYADIDLNKCIQPKQMHDILGGYNRFDIFELIVHTKKNEPIHYEENKRSAKAEPTIIA